MMMDGKMKKMRFRYFSNGWYRDGQGYMPGQVHPILTLNLNGEGSFRQGLFSHIVDES